MNESPSGAAVAVASWDGDNTLAFHEEIWTAWLHGAVAAVHDADQLLLVVPVGEITPTVSALAMRLYQVGSVVHLGVDAA